MQAFNKLPINFDIVELKAFLEVCDLWDKYPQRREPQGSPHSEMVDIWARFKDPREHIESGDWSGFTGEHESVWLEDIKEVKSISGDLMSFLDGEALGGVLITKLPPGGKINPHIDSGWHAEYYDKYFISIKNQSGAKFCFEGGEIEPKEGDVYAFRNDKMHWVENNSKENRIAMIICIKQNKLSKEGVCLGQQQQQ